jgi:hypothetical protein
MTEPNPDAVKASKREYRRANRDRIRERKRQYYTANRDSIREQQREYYQATRQERLKAVKAYKDANEDKILEGHRRYYGANKGKILGDRRRYYGANRDNRRMSTLRRTHADFDLTWAAMWETQQGCCYLCKLPMDAAETVMEHWHGCPGHDPYKSCRYCQRGLAHQKCNSAIGLAGDDPAILRVIADNLERANADIAARQATMPQHITLF